jgi:hypothetical protein
MCRHQCPIYYVHVGDFGKNSVSSVFRASTLEEMLENDELQIPFQTSLPLEVSSETFPYCFVADEAFTLKTDLMRPYPRRMLTNKRCILQTLMPKKL